MLNDTTIRALKPEAKPRKVFDQGGLYLLITPQGSKLWRLKYRIGARGQRKERILCIGVYPKVSLKKARRIQAQAKEIVENGLDPITQHQAQRGRAVLAQAETFEVIGRQWHSKFNPRWTPRHAEGVLSRLKNHVFPELGNHHIDAISPRAVKTCLDKIEQRGAHATAHVVRQHIDAVFAYAIAAGIGNSNPAVQVKGALAPVERGHQPAILTLDGIRDLLRQIEAEPSYPPTKLALRLLALTACRPSEVREAAWREFEDLGGKAPLWRITPARMRKTKLEHIVPLSPQAVAVIETLRPLSGHLDLLFPNTRSAERPMSRNAFLDVLYRCGFKGEHCAHGFRSSFSTIMNERHPGDWAAIEAALAHIVGGTRGAYMRGNYLERRRELMAEWANLLLEGAPPPETLLFGPRR